MRIDHVEVYVPSRHDAAAWYETALGFRIVDAHRHWVDGGGPLMIRRPGDDFMLALFRGAAQADHEVRGLRRLAFRVSGPEFLEFLTGSEAWRDRKLGLAEIQDHEKAVSVYFSDPWGTPIEITTYEPQVVRDGLGLRDGTA